MFARVIQGRMTDINLLLAAHATRTENGVGSKLRDFHLLMGQQ
jgi:hypothetical protein